MGAWIEIIANTQSTISMVVAPHVGAWIEIYQLGEMFINFKSHPTWVRGLKFQAAHAQERLLGVAPHVGAWIEIGYSL